MKETYLKVPKFSDARKLCCYLPKFQTKSPKLRVFYQNDANGIANCEDPDQTAQDSSSSLIWVCTVCPDLSVQKLRVITVVSVLGQLQYLQDFQLQFNELFATEKLYTCSLDISSVEMPSMTVGVLAFPDFFPFFFLPLFFFFGGCREEEKRNWFWLPLHRLHSQKTYFQGF